MTGCGYNIENKKQISSKYVHQTLRGELSEMSTPEILELVHTTHDIVLLTRIFYFLGLYLLSEESGCDKIIKCKVLYDKILIVLKCGLQTKVCVALNLISALLFFGDEPGYSRRKTLHIYSQNMIKTSGCLAAMCDLFTNCMMQRTCARALCVSLCLSAGAAQAQCAHLVMQCIQRCRQDLTETFSLLQILLCNNDRNIQLFHESNGMTIFTRESLQHPACLHLLSTLAENRSPQNKIIFNQSSELFATLQSLLSKYGSDSMVGKWALIILYSRHKAIETNAVNNVVNANDTAKDDTVPIHNIQEECENMFPCSHNETSQLFRNVYKEIMILQKQNYNKNYKSDLNCYKDILVLGKDNEFRMNNFTTNRKRPTPIQNIYKDKNTSPPLHHPTNLITKTNDLSFSFLKKQNTNININTNRVIKSNLFEETQATEFVKYDSDIMSTKNRIESNINNTILEFEPPFVSTPKQKPRLRTRSLIKRQDKLNGKVQRIYKSKHLIKRQMKDKKQNKSMSTKFFDLINGSCTTLVKSFTNIKNIFKRKISGEVNEETKNTISTVTNSDSCSYSFTNYMQKRDAYLQEYENTLLTKEFTEKLDSYCNTCNDTSVLKHKLANDKSLQKTIKKLKLGINLYGCNFKKISSTMWPRETYMTPSVLYNLYRKLVIK